LNPVSFAFSTCSTLNTLVSPLIGLSSKHQNPQESFQIALLQLSLRTNRWGLMGLIPIFSKSAGWSFLRTSMTYVSNFIMGMSVFEVLMVLLLF
jgi:hypothetical protein